MGRLCILFFAVSMLGCAHSVHLVHAGDFDMSGGSGRVVKVEGEQFVIMHFTDNIDYIEKTYERLMAACPGGEIDAITTEFMTSLGFFSWTNKVFMRGECLASASGTAYGGQIQKKGKSSTVKQVKQK